MGSTVRVMKRVPAMLLLVAALAMVAGDALARRPDRPGRPPRVAAKVVDGLLDDWTGVSPMVAGVSTVSHGEFVHQDYIYDDTGATVGTQTANAGRGLGHAFFDHREAQARALGRFAHVAFCAVVRPDDHPLRPKDYMPLDGFCQKRGYAKVDGLIARFTWKDIDQPAESGKPMQFWMRAL